METWSTTPSATDNGIHASEHSERVWAAKYTGNQLVPRAPAFDPPLSKFRTRPLDLHLVQRIIWVLLRGSHRPTNFSPDMEHAFCLVPRPVGLVVSRFYTRSYASQKFWTPRTRHSVPSLSAFSRGPTSRRTVSTETLSLLIFWPFFFIPRDPRDTSPTHPSLSRPLSPSAHSDQPYSREYRV